MAANRFLLLILFSAGRCAAQTASVGYPSWQETQDRAERLMQTGRFAEALAFLAAIRDHSDTGGLPADSSAATLNAVGSAYHALGRHEDAERCYLRGIHMLDCSGSAAAPLMSRLLDNLASLYMDAGRPPVQVERLRRRALALRIAEVGPEGPGVATLLCNLATVCMAQGRNAEAVTLFERALQVAAKNGETDVILAGVLHNLAVLSAETGRFPDAESYLERAVTAFESAQGRDHSDLVRPLLNMGRLQLAMNRPREAEPPLARALMIAEARLGPEHPVVVEILLSYADVYQRTRRKAEAREARRRAAAIAELHPASAKRYSVDVSELRRKHSSAR